MILRYTLINLDDYCEQRLDTGLGLVVFCVRSLILRLKLCLFCFAAYLILESLFEFGGWRFTLELLFTLSGLGLMIPVRRVFCVALCVVELFDLIVLAWFCLWCLTEVGNFDNFRLIASCA